MTDPITVATIGTALIATTGEMSESLRRSSYSPIIREMLDFSCAIFTPEGEMAAQSETIPALLGAMPIALRALIEDNPPAEVREGDIFVTNDPYRGGTHTPDIHVFAPVFHDGGLIGWTGTLAHHADIGGTNPGTEGYANRSIFEEGLRFPPVRLFDAGKPVTSLFRYIETNVRDPRATLGDFRAQVAAVKLGALRFGEVVDKYGLSTVHHAMRDVLDQTERRLRAAISERSDGSATATGYLDNDGVGNDDIRIVATVTVHDDEVRVDFNGTAPAMGGGMNASRTAVMAAVLFAVKAVFDPEGLPNSGNTRPISVQLPAGSLVNPPFPAAVSLRHLTAQRICDTVIRAFADLYPDLGVAGAFVGFSSIAAEGRGPRTGEITVPQDDLGGGMGGTSSNDGLDAVDTYLGNVGILPAEICELQYPIRVRRTELVKDSGGAGRHRGGLAMLREYEFTATCDLVAYTEQSSPGHAAWGAAEGRPGLPAQVVVVRRDGSRETITKKRQTVHAGDRVEVRSGGGGGYGPPDQRDRVLIARDLRHEKISDRLAIDAYGCSESDLTRWASAEPSPENSDGGAAPQRPALHQAAARRR